MFFTKNNRILLLFLLLALSCVEAFSYAYDASSPFFSLKVQIEASNESSNKSSVFISELRALDTNLILVELKEKEIESDETDDSFCNVLKSKVNTPNSNCGIKISIPFQKKFNTIPLFIMFCTLKLPFLS
jgi:hypothetical protein